jgi:hypothetical protein
MRAPDKVIVSRKSHASRASAWERRKSAHVLVARSGAGSIPASWRICQTVEADTLAPRTTEILALRHQITVLERQLGGERVRFSPGDRSFLAALLHRLPSEVLRRIRLVVRPDTVLRWHRDLVARRHAARFRPKRPGRPRTVRSVRLCLSRSLMGSRRSTANAFATVR